MSRQACAPEAYSATIYLTRVQSQLMGELYSIRDRAARVQVSSAARRALV